jgi:hypothetical protein
VVRARVGQKVVGGVTVVADLVPAAGAPASAQESASRALSEA